MACIYIINGKQFSEIDQSAIDELIKANLLEPNSAKTIAMAYQIAKEDNTNPDFTDKIDAILNNSPQQNEKQNNQNTNEATKSIEKEVAQLRAAEQAEYDAMSNPKDEAKRKEIYDRYDKLITPLLEKESSVDVETKKAEINKRYDEEISQYEIEIKQAEEDIANKKKGSYLPSKNKQKQKIADINENREIELEELEKQSKPKAEEGSVGVGGGKIKLDPDLANIDPILIAARNGDVAAQKQFEEMGLDWKQTTTYRFVGQSEVDVLLSNKKVESKRGMADAGIDVTSSPKVTTAATGEYRVTFKESFDKNNGLGKVRKKNEEDSNLERGRGYDINDVAKIERIDEKGNVVETIYDQSKAGSIVEVESAYGNFLLNEIDKRHKEKYNGENIKSALAKQFNETLADRGENRAISNLEDVYMNYVPEGVKPQAYQALRKNFEKEQSLKETPPSESKPKAKPKKKRPARKNKVISKILDEFTVEPIDKVLQYFIGGGKINGDRKNPENAIQKIFGKKGGVKDLDKTYKSYFNLTRNNASTISQLAHSLWEDNRDYSDYTSQDYEEAIIEVLSTHNGTNTMKEAFNDKFQINIPAEEMEMDIENEREELEYIENQAEALREEYRDPYYEELDKLLAETPNLVFQLNDNQLQQIEDDLFITNDTIELTDEQYNELQLIFIENENQNKTNEREVDSSNEQVQGKSLSNKDDEKKSALEAKVKEAKNAYQTAQGKLTKTKQAAEKAGQEQQNNIFGGKPADALLFGTDLRSLNEKVKERQAEVDKAKENLDKAQLALDSFVPSNQVQLEIEPTEAVIVKDPILKRLNKAFLKIGAEILDNAEQLAAKAKQLASGGKQVQYSITLPDGSQKQVKAIDVDVVNGFYSPLEKIISEVKQDKMPAKQWAEKFAKGEEAKWTGLADWLNEQQGSVSKADIQNFLKENRIEVVEVVKGEATGSDILNDEQLKRLEYLTKLDEENPSGAIEDIEAGSYDELLYLLNVRDKSTSEDLSRLQRETERKARMADRAGNKKLSDKLWNDSHRYTARLETLELSEEGQGGISNPTKFSQYQLEGEKENYKEVLVTLPSKVPNYTPITELPSGYDITFDSRNNTYAVIEENQTSGKSITGRYHNTQEDAVKNAIEVINAQRKNVITGKAFDSQFKSTHFDEPNILVHLRMNTRTDADGNKVLFLEEVQSDWGQKGKKEGFKGEELDPANLTFKVTPEGTFNLYQLYDKNGNLVFELPASKSKGDNVFTKESLRQEFKGSQAIELMGKTTPTAPFVMDTNAWTKLGLKVALKEAVKQGADKIAWTTGEQQNDRYNLKKDLNYLDYWKNANGTYGVTLDFKKPQEFTKPSELTERELTDYFGKEIATKIVSDTSSPTENNPKRLEGDDLAVGGKGMKGFYGSPTEGSLGIVGSVAKSLFKQEPKTVEIGTVKFEKIYNVENYDEFPQEVSDLFLNLEDVDNDQEIANGLKKLGYTIIDQSPADFGFTKFGKKEGTSSTQHSIDITPELKATVEQGQPLFHLNDKGEILGFTYNGKIYLNGEKITAKTTMEEAGHIWINWAKENRSDLYQQGLEKVQGSKYLIEVNNNPSYQKEALKQGEKGSEGYNAYMQEEALAKAIADNGAKFISETRKAGFREWVNAMWKEVAKAFGIQKLKPSEVKALTLEEFAKMAAADVFSNKETPSQEQAVDKANPQIAETIKATLRGEMNADDAAISLDEKGIEVTNEIYDSLRDAEKQFQKEKAGIQVGDTVMVKGRNGNPDFEANFRGLDKNGKYIVYNTESGTTFSITKDEIITPISKESELADLKEQLKKARTTPTKRQIQARIDELEGNEPKAPKGPSDGLGSRTAANTNNITPTQNAERVSMKFHLELKKLIESIGVPIAERNLSKRFLGIFKHRSMNIRVQSLFGVATAAHETAHWVSKKFGIGEALRDKSAIVAANPDAQLNKDLRKALTDIYTEFYPNAKREHSLYLRVEEGIAVLMEHYLTDPTDISNRYGILVDNFIAPTGKYYHPKFTELLDKLNKFLAEYSALSPNEKIGSRIVSGEEVTKKNEGFTPAQSIVRGLVNAAEPLRRADNIADAGLTEESTEVAYIRWLSRAGIIAPWITGETHPITLDKNGNWKEVGASVKDYLELIKGREAEFSQYLVARRNLGDVNYLTEMENELAEILANIENEEDLTKEEVEEINELSARIEKQKQIIKNDNFDIQQVTATVRMFEDEFKAPVAIYDKLNNAVVDFAQKSGLISNEKAEAYKANTTYASFKRLILDDISAGGSAVGSDPKSQVGAFKTRTGTDLQIIDPVYSQIQFISETLNKGMQNMIWQKLAALSDTNVELARRFEKVPTIAIEDPITGAITYPQLNDPTKRVVLFNGKKSFYLAAPEYVALAETLTPKELETMAYILTKSAGIFSRLTTSANPLFPLVNIPIDTMSAWMNTKTGFIPGWSQMRAIPEMASYAKDKALLSAKNLANTAIDFLHNMIIIGDWFKGIKNIPIKNLSLEEQNLFAKYLALGGSTQTLSAYLDMSPEEMIKAITKKSLGKKVVQTIDDFTLGILEMPSNASEYMTRFAEFKRAKDQGYSDDVAMYMAAHVSVPFIQSGTYGGQVGKTTVKSVAYFHAGIQVISKFAQTAKNNPMRTATIGAALIAIKISQTLLTMALSDDDDKRMLAEQEPSELAKYIYVPNKLFGGKGFTRIRFGNEFGSISAPIEMMILQNKGLAKYNYKDYLDATTTAIPQQFNILKPIEALWAYTPQIVKPSLEVGFNVRTYPNVRPIVPYGVSFKSPMNQYNQYTTETSKYLGKLAGVSPMKIDYFIKAQFGKVPDMLIRKTEQIAFDKKDKSKSQLFLQEEQYVLAGRNYNDFYENNKYWQELYNDLHVSNRREPLTEQDIEVIQNHKIFEATGKVLTELRHRIDEGQELPETIKQAAFELLKDLNSSDKPYTLTNKYTNLINQLNK